MASTFTSLVEIAKTWFTRLLQPAIVLAKMDCLPNSRKVHDRRVTSHSYGLSRWLNASLDQEYGIRLENEIDFLVRNFRLLQALKPPTFGVFLQFSVNRFAGYRCPLVLFLWDFGDTLEN